MGTRRYSEPPIASGDLVVSLETGAETVLAHDDVDEYIAVLGSKVAFTRHHGDATDGVSVMDLP